MIQIHPLYPDDVPILAQWGLVLPTPLEEFDHAWVMRDHQDRPIGYAVVVPVPGLPGLADLTGSIVPDRRRQGYGRHLLHHVLTHLRYTDVHQVSVSVPTLQTPTAYFLRAQGFFVEHEECTLHLADLTTLPQLPPCPDGHVFSLSAPGVVAEQFCTLYEQSFAGRPWFQPYTPAEVLGTFDAPTDILFLSLESVPTPIGFVWLRRQGDEAEIEPIGIVSTWQGRGYGRFLLLTTLHYLAQQGIRQVQISLWQDNQPALRLYQSLGFQPQETLIYLARNV